MAAAIALRDDFDGPALRKLGKGTKMRRRRGGFSRLRRFMTGARAPTRPGSGMSAFRPSATGFCASTRAALPD